MTTFSHLVRIGNDDPISRSCRIPPAPVSSYPPPSSKASNFSEDNELFDFWSRDRFSRRRRPSSDSLPRTLLAIRSSCVFLGDISPCESATTHLKKIDALSGRARLWAVVEFSRGSAGRNNGGDVPFESRLGEDENPLFCMHLAFHPELALEVRWPNGNCFLRKKTLTAACAPRLLKWHPVPQRTQAL